MEAFRRILRMGRGAVSAFRVGGVREVMWRVRLRLMRIDLATTSIEDLSLTAERSIRHGSSAGPALELILKGLKIDSTHSVLDMGSGKGGALMTLARFPFRKLAGVELSPRMIAIAEENCERRIPLR